MSAQWVRIAAVVAAGQKLQPDEVAVRLGQPELTFQASEQRSRRVSGL